MDEKRTKTLEELMQNDDGQEENLKEEIKEEEKEERKSKTKFCLIAVAVFVVLILIGGGYAGWRIYDANQATEEETETDTIPPDSDEGGVEVQKEISVNADDGLNLRQEASADSQPLTIIPNGTKLTVLEEVDAWYKVTYGGQTGWIAQEYTTTQ